MRASIHLGTSIFRCVEFQCLIKRLPQILLTTHPPSPPTHRHSLEYSRYLSDIPPSSTHHPLPYHKYPSPRHLHQLADSSHTRVSQIPKVTCPIQPIGISSRNPGLRPLRSRVAPSWLIEISCTTAFTPALAMRDPSTVTDFVGRGEWARNCSWNALPPDKLSD